METFGSLFFRLSKFSESFGHAGIIHDFIYRRIIFVTVGVAGYDRICVRFLSMLFWKGELAFLGHFFGGFS